jgi:hypothetical protein
LEEWSVGVLVTVHGFRGSGFHFCPPDSTLEADCLMTTPFFALPHENQGSKGTYFSEDSLLRQVLGSSILSLFPTLNVEPGTCEPLRVLELLEEMEK